VTKTTLFRDAEVKQADSFVIEVGLTEVPPSQPPFPVCGLNPGQKNYKIEEPFPSVRSFEFANQLVVPNAGDVVLLVRDKDQTVRGLYAQRWILIKHSEYFASRLKSLHLISNSDWCRVATMLE